MGRTVVRAQAWRRWSAVLGLVAVLCAVPVAIARWPVPAVDVAAAGLRDRIAASADRAYHGFAQTSGLLPLPSLPNLRQLTDLLSTTTDLRVWYAARDRWRVDVLDGSTERDLYQVPGSQWLWDYGDSRLTHIMGEQPVRLPAAADLTPPALTRWILGLAGTERLEPTAARRVAGIVTAGLRIVPATADTTVDHIDVWADPVTGVPVQAEVTARGGTRPVFVTRFLELHLDSPDPAVLRPPAPHGGIDVQMTRVPDVLGAINRRFSGELPDTLAGAARRTAVAGTSAVAVYGTGLTQFVVVALPGRFGAQAYDRIETFGSKLDVPAGFGAALLPTGLVTVLAFQADRTYLVAGLVRPALLERVADDLVGGFL